MSDSSQFSNLEYVSLDIGSGKVFASHSFSRPRHWTRSACPPFLGSYNQSLSPQSTGEIPFSKRTFSFIQFTTLPTSCWLMDRFNLGLGATQRVIADRLRLNPKNGLETILILQQGIGSSALVSPENLDRNLEDIALTIDITSTWYF